MTAKGSLVVVGDALLDRDVVGTVERLSPDAPVPVVDQDAVRSRPGGAGLAAALAAADGRRVTLVTALGTDAAGAELAAILDARGVEVIDLGLGGPTPEKVRIGPAGRPLLRLDRGGGGDVGAPGAEARAAIGWGAAVLVADYGRGVAAEPELRDALAGVAHPVVWDPHPRGPAPIAGATLVTPNLAESKALEPGIAGDALPVVARRARALARRWQAAAVSVTCGARGAVLVDGAGPPFFAAAEPAPGGDPCGAGDRFASCAAGALADGAAMADAVLTAVDIGLALRRGRGRRRDRAGRPGRAGRRRPRSDPIALARAHARGRRHRRRHRRLLRPPAPRPRPDPAGGAGAGRLPRRVPELRRLRAGAQGPRPPGRRPGGPRGRPARAGLRGRRPDLRRARRPPRRSSGCARTSGPRAATTPTASCPRRASSPGGAGRSCCCRS